MAFGEGPLSQPLVVEALEELFHPVAIRNNVEGYEKDILQRYEEPTWNNPVMRFVDGQGKDVIPRKDRQWSMGQVVARLVEALQASKRTAPRWLRGLASETSAAKVATARFAMT